MRKLQDKVARCQDAVKKSKEQYELSLLDINNYNSRYMEVRSAETNQRPLLPVFCIRPRMDPGFFAYPDPSVFCFKLLQKYQRNFIFLTN